MSRKTDYTGFEVAVIGMSGRFPGAKDIGEFWENLINGKESISFFTDEELLESGIKPEILANPNYIKVNGFLEGSEYFDSFFFGYTEIEATLMDPQTRIFHECAWGALEDAGYCPDTYNGLIGLYVGADDHFHWRVASLFSNNVAQLGVKASQLLMNKDFLGGWVSYKLNLKGPSYTLSTACSTSLVAIHVAGQAILNGECDIALAGGVNITQLNKTGYLCTTGMPFSSDGHLHAFDAGPHGIIGGNGAAVVLLKRLDDAVKDRDHIYAIIKGSAINNDGVNKVGFTAPSVDGQARVVRAALEMAEVEPETIGYVEAHGTATELGDPIEIQALKLAFNTDKRQYCRIGSVKTNIGHLSAAAGVAGLIKAALCVKHGMIPASLNFKFPNPKIDFKNSPFYVNAELSEWKDEFNPRRAGVSSFGLGGTNAHVILEEAPQAEPSSQSREFQILLLSAKTEAALDRNTQNLALYLEKNPGINLADVSYTLQTGRKPFPYRRMTVTPNRENLVQCLSFPEYENPPSVMVREEDRPLVFVFSGQGSQYVNMGLDLYNQEPQFREEMDHGFHILESLSNVNIKEILYPSGERLPDAKEKIAQYGGPITLILEYSLAKLLMQWGFTPQAMIGYSFGEYTAACLSGVFSLEDVLKLSVLRGQMMVSMPEGSMMSVPLPEGELRSLVNPDIDIAAVNGPSFCIVSGAPQPIKELRMELKDKGHECYRFLLFRAGHSKMMIPYKEEFMAHFNGIPMNPPQIPYVSGLTGNWVTRKQATSPEYWARHMTETIRFYDGIGLLLREFNPIFVQVGADRGLPQYIGMHPLKEEENLALNLVRYPKEEDNDVHFLLSGIGRLWQYGAKVNWENFYAHEKRSRISLPTYSFESTPYPPLGDIRKIIADIRSGRSMDSSALLSKKNETIATKVENTALHAVQRKRKRPKLKTPYAPPTNDMEQKLVEIFQSFFGIEPIGIYDDFYDLGGDSLKAVQLAGVIKKNIVGIQLSLQHMLYYQNIHGICQGLRSEEKNGKDKPLHPKTDTQELKNEVSEEDLLLIKEELNKVNRLSDLLKENSPSREYGVSPIQALSLIPPYLGVSMDFASASYDFPYLTDDTYILDVVKTLVQQNTLLRSVIIKKDDRYFIKEFDSFSNIYLPFLDLTSYSFACRERIIDQVFAYLNIPMEVLDHVLFRAAIVKVESESFKLILQINHLIGDGTCVGILEKQLHDIKQKIGTLSQDKVDSMTDYYDYVQFMKGQNYDHIDLGNYINLRDYSHAIETVLENYKIAELRFESFEVDISVIDEEFRVYCHEIALWVFSKLVGDLFGINRVPIEYLTNGRIYKGGNFNHIIGDFHDTIPVLLNLNGDLQTMMEHFIDYKRFIRENNLNFMNYLTRGYLSDLKKAKWKSPFSFNALIGSSEFFKGASQRKRLENLSFSSPHFGMSLLEDFSACKLWIKFVQNAGDAIKDLYMKNFLEVVNDLDRNFKKI
ncbi:MAG: beta-ketoacyl synthase N-terminal-like domain-containing protein [Candidatus Omnitrophota bacterium]